MSSCSSTKNISKKNDLNYTSTTKADKIIEHASSYFGTKYKYGGTSKSGMDCSGLVFTAFGEEDIQLPRVSRDMAKKGEKISLSEVTNGDLLFFATSKNRNRINHVAVVSEVKNGIIKFIHSTISEGVTESSLLQNYWKKAFVKATRILN